MSARTRPRRDAGFTLVEVIVALALLAFGVLAMVRLTGGLSAEMRRAGLQTGVVEAAQTRLESMEALGFEGLTPGTTTDTVVVRGRAFVRETEVTSVGLRLKRVEVRVVPAVPPGPSHVVQTYVHKSW
jgi:prepilin-type N-terminal cleavage/methylation domain-containing protein